MCDRALVRILALLPCAWAASMQPGCSCPDDISLTVDRPPTYNDTSMKIIGHVPYPEGTILNISLLVNQEIFTSNHIALVQTTIHRLNVPVIRSRFIADFQEIPPGQHTVAVDHAPKIQKDTVRDKIVFPKHRSFTVYAWDDHHIEGLAALFNDMEALLRRARQLIENARGASGNHSQWEEERTKLYTEANNIAGLIDKSASSQAFAATGNCLKDAMQNLKLWVNMGHLDDRGDLVSPDMISPTEPRDGQKRNTLNWNMAQNICEEMTTVAEREYVLWLIKDRRRTGNVGAAVAEKAQLIFERPGISTYIGRIRAGCDYDELEKSVRIVR